MESKIRIDLQRKGGGLPSCRGSGSCEFLIQWSLRKSPWQNRSLITLTDRPAICSRSEARQASGCIKIQPLRDVGRTGQTRFPCKQTARQGHVGTKHLKEKQESPVNSLWKSAHMTDRGTDLLKAFLFFACLFPALSWSHILSVCLVHVLKVSTWNQSCRCVMM